MRTLCACLVVLVATSALSQSRPKKGKEPEPAPTSQPAAATPAEPTPPAPPPEPSASPAAAPKLLTLSADEKPKLVVLPLVPQGVPPEQAAAVSDALVSALAARGLFQVVSNRDIETALGADRQRQLLGVCESNPDACGVSLGDVMAAPFVLSGQLSRVGSAWQLSLQTVETGKARALGRSNRLAPSLEELQRLVPWAAAEATGSPLPPPPSRVVPILLLTTGGLAVAAGAVAGVVTLTQQAQLNDELCPGGVPDDGRCTGEGLRERAFYVTQNEALTRQKWLAAGLLAGGAVLTALGLLVMPPSESQSRLSAVLVPTWNGFAISGGFW